MRFDFVFYVDGDFEILQNILRYESSLRGLCYSENLSKDIDCYKYVFGVEMEARASGAEGNSAHENERGKSEENGDNESNGDNGGEIPLQDSEQNPLLEFANTLAQKIPLSLKFRFSSIESVAQDEDSAGQPKPPKGESARKSSQDAAPTTPNSIPALNETDAPNCPKIPPLDAQTITQIIKNQDLPQMQKYLSATSFVRDGEEQEFAQALDFIQEELESQKPVVLHTSRGKIAISALPFDGYTDIFGDASGALFESSAPRPKNPPAPATNTPAKVLFWNLSTLRTYMRAEAAQCDALASYEKPSMMLSTKEVFSEALGREVECVLAYDLFLGVLGERCSARQMDYVFVRELDSALGLNGEADWVSNLPYHIAYTQEVPQEERIVLAQNGLVLYCGESRAQSLQEIIRVHGDLLDEAQNLEGTSAHGAKEPPPQKSRLQKAREERLGGKIAGAKNSSGAQETRRLEGNEALIVSLSRDNPMCFWLKSGEKYQSALNAEFELNARLVFEGIASYKDGDKLLANFRRAVPQIDAHLESLGQVSQKSRNIFAFLGVVAKVLGYGEDAHALLENAKGYVRDKGPRIDYKLVKSPQNILSLDYPKILRSCMSFYLAGVDRETLSYGVLDSLGEFVGNLMQDLCVNFAARKILLCGNLLEEKILLDKILHYAPRDVRLILPKKGYLDYP